VAENAHESKKSDPTPLPAAAPAGAVTHPPADAKKPDKELVFHAGRRAKAAASAVKKYFSGKRGFWRDLLELFPSLVSNDRPTRRMAVLFFISLSCSLSLVTFVLKRYWDSRKEMLIAEARIRAKKVSEIIMKETEEARRKASMLSVGRFTLELKEPPDQTASRGQDNMAEVDLVILCDQAETRDYLEHHLVQLRNEMTGVFTALDREELLSRDGKRKLKSLLIQRINDWLPEGHVEDIYFSKLLIS
jgi:flagellar basal body-associated protein FliL